MDAKVHKVRENNESSKSFSATACGKFNVSDTLPTNTLLRATILVTRFLALFQTAKSMVNMRLDLGRQSKAYHALGVFCVLLLMQKGSAREFLVGGSGNWGTPTDNSTLSFSQWAEKNRFQIGDSIVFNYASDQDSVLQVNKDAYASCDTESPIASYNDGHTVFAIKESGPHYFISGKKENCLNNEKLVVIVMADRSNRSSNTTNGTSPSPPPSPPPSSSPPPSPPPSSSPPPSPSSNLVPAQAPAGENSPPEGTVEVNPTPAPDSETKNKPNAASSNFISLVTSCGAFAVSSFLLAV